MSVLGLQMSWTVAGQELGPDGLRTVATAFERAGAELADMGKHVFPKLIPVLEEAVAAQFAAEGDGPIAGGWASLSPSYAAWKQGRAPGMPILQLSGDMRAALTTSSSPLALRDYTSAQLNYGTQGVQYASYHQEGTGRMPARPPFDFGPDFEAEVSRTALQGVREAVREGSNGMLNVEGES